MDYLQALNNFTDIPILLIKDEELLEKMRLENNGLDMTNIQLNQSRQVTDEIKEIIKIKETDKQSLDKSEMASMVDKLNEFIEPLRTTLKFRMHEKLEDYYVEVVDQETKEVIREIPPKEMLDMYAEMAELMGIIIDKKI